MQIRSHKLFPALCAFVLSAGCGKGKSPEGTSPSSTTATAQPNTTAAPSVAGDTSGASDASATQEPKEPAAGDGTIVVVGDTNTQELVLTSYSTASDGAATIKPDAQGRVTAGIYKVPGGSYIAVPEGGTVHVRPDESRGVMVGGLPFQLDTEVKLVGEADEGGLSFSRKESTEADAMPRFGPRSLKPGEKVEGPAILGQRDLIHQVVLHSDLAADSKAAFRKLLRNDLSDHFNIDFDGTLYQTLDVAMNAYHAGDANNHSIGVTLNNMMANLERDPEATAYPATLPEGASLTPPADATAPPGVCKLVAGDIACEVKGTAFGVITEGAAVVAGGGTFFTTVIGENWEPAVAPFEPIGLSDVGGNLVAYGAAGDIAVSKDLGTTWGRIETTSKAAWRDAWVGWTDDGYVMVLVGDGGAIARSANLGETFAIVASPAKNDLQAIGKVGEDRLVASFGTGAVESKDFGVSWTLVADKLDLATLVPVPGAGRCTDRLPAPGEVCAYAATVTRQTGVEAFVQSGDIAVAYLTDGYALTSDGGFSWKEAVTGARVEEMAQFPRTASERMEINGAKVRAFGYTEAQYKSLGALVRTLANVFPALQKVGGLDADGNVINRVLDAPESVRGIVGHWHTEADRWDPGPGFDWARLAKELAETPR